MAKVELDKVQKIYDEGIEAVRQISLEIHDKEFMVLVGPSGCGKSTLLRMIAGLEDVTHGTIRIGRKAVNNCPPKDRNIAMVFQSYALYPHMTVYDNMAFSLKLRKRPKNSIEAEVKKAADILGISDLLQRKPKALSGGQRQRVAVGRAIVRNPDVFLFDEPLSNLDAQLRLEMRRELRRLHQRLKTTMIYVTHDQVEAMTLGDRICVMNLGSIHQVASPLEIYDNPADLFVAGFFGTSPMNFLSGTLSRDPVPFIFDTGPVRIALPDHWSLPLGAHVDRQVTLGIRPEHIKPWAGTAPHNKDDNLIHGIVESTEALGEEQIVHISLGPQQLACKADSHYRLSAGERIDLQLNMEKAHIFDADKGNNLVPA